MRKPIISIKLSNRDYAGLANLGNRVHASLTGNASYATPIPTLTALQTAITNVEDAIAAWGSGSNRGSKADLADLRVQAVALHQSLKALSQYVQNTAQLTAGSDYELMQSIIMTSGFNVANQRNPQGLLQAPQGFRLFVSRKLYRNQVKFKWAKPLNTTTTSNVKSYRVLRGTTAVFAAATEIGITTKTSFVDTNSTGALQTWTYWVLAVNTAGEGVPSDAVTVSVLG